MALPMGFEVTLNTFTPAHSFVMRNLQCIRCVPRMCRDPARPRAVRNPLLLDSAANRGVCQCRVRSVGGAWPNFRSSRPVRTHAIHQTQVEMRPKSTHIAFSFFCLSSRRGWKGGTATHDGGFAIGPLREVYEAGVRSDLSKW